MNRPSGKPSTQLGSEMVPRGTATAHVVVTKEATLGKANLDKSDSQPSLRDCSWFSCLTRTNILGHSQPFLQDWFRYILTDDLFSASAYFNTLT